MSEFLIYTVPGSPYARAVAATLEEKHLPWRVQGLEPKAVRGPEHLVRHPFGRMPVLRHDDFELYETQAILRYIDRLSASPALTPINVRLAARMDQLMNINDCYLFHGCAAITWNRVIGPRLLGLSPDEAAIADVMPRALTVFRELARLLGEQTFFAGDRVSLADLMLAPQIDFFARAPEWDELTSAAVGVGRWLERMRARPSMQNTTWDAVAAKAA